MQARSLCFDSQADRAGHTGATDATIAIGVLGQILLVIILGKVEHWRGQGSVSVGLIRVFRVELRLVLGAVIPRGLHCLQKGHFFRILQSVNL